MNKFVVLLMVLLLSSCGTTSSLRHAQNSSLRPNLKDYNCVIVNDFTDGVTNSQDDPNIISEGKRFADVIASKIKARNYFVKVKRNANSKEKAILIDGQITQYDEGSMPLRVLVGLGAGSSHFDADVLVKDNTTKALLGDIKVDRMSWALGGVIAGTQDVKSHMMVAADKISEEVCKTKE